MASFGLGFKHLKAKSFAQVQIFQVVIKSPDFQLICERAQPQHMIFPKLVKFRSFNMKFAHQVDLTKKVVFAVLGKGTLFVSQASPPLQIRIPEVSRNSLQKLARKKTGLKQIVRIHENLNVSKNKDVVETQPHRAGTCTHCST